MGLDNETNRSDAEGDGGTTDFSFTFRIDDEPHLRVILTDEDGVETYPVLTTDYTIDQVGLDAGGVVTFAVAPPVGTHVALVRHQTVTQDASIKNGGPNHAATLEGVLDRIVMLLQQVSEEASRGLHIPDGETEAHIKTHLPAKVSRANRYIKFDADGVVELVDDAVSATSKFWGREGALTTGSNDRFVPYTAFGEEVYTRLHLRVLVAPTGGDITVEMLLNGSTVVGEATIPDGETSVLVEGLTMTIGDLEFIKPSITAVGSTTPGTTLAITMLP